MVIIIIIWFLYKIYCQYFLKFFIKFAHFFRILLPKTIVDKMFNIFCHLYSLFILKNDWILAASGDRTSTIRQNLHCIKVLCRVQQRHYYRYWTGLRKQCITNQWFSHWNGMRTYMPSKVYLEGPKSKPFPAKAFT